MTDNQLFDYRQLTIRKKVKKNLLKFLLVLTIYRSFAGDNAHYL